VLANNPGSAFGRFRLQQRSNRVIVWRSATFRVSAEIQQRIAVWRNPRAVINHNGHRLASFRMWAQCPA
jgi:hypothetical protein